jgi:hypothetical protein
VKLCILRYSLVRRIGKFTVFVELFVVFGYEAYGREAGAVLIWVFKRYCHIRSERVFLYNQVERGE